MTSTSRPSLLLLATMATKADEVAFFAERLCAHGIEVETLDISLQSGGVVLGGSDKVTAIEQAAEQAMRNIAQHLDAGINAVAGIGGGTGGEIILRAFRALPPTFPKLLVTTLAFDPRAATADNSIVLVPALSDICGLNPTLRDIFENTAAMAAGLCLTHRHVARPNQQKSVAVTSLGVTEHAVLPVCRHLQAQGHETTVFHANGYGGAAFARFAARGAFQAMLDITPHEMTRLEVAGACVDMPSRFTVAPDLPRIVLPGALNFVGLGEIGLLPKGFVDRPHYAHTGFFTHAKLTSDEMVRVATRLAEALNSCTGPRQMIVPMGGFSSQDKPGGLIEDPGLRAVFLETIRPLLASDIGLSVLPHHLFAPEVTTEIMRCFEHFNIQPQDAQHV